MEGVTFIGVGKRLVVSLILRTAFKPKNLAICVRVPLSGVINIVTRFSERTDAFTVASDARINDENKDRSNWPITERLVETIGSFPNVVRCDLMGQIGHMQCGSDRFSDTIHHTDRTIS